MNFRNTNKPCISFCLNLRVNMRFRFLEKPEIMAFPRRKSCADYFSAALIDYHLCFHSMPFFLARIIPFLLVFTVLYSLFVTPPVFFGRSTGDSVASICIISYSILLSSNAFLPGNENVPSFISASSTHLCIRIADVSCTS